MSSPDPKRLASTPPTQPVSLTNGLSLFPRLHLLLTIHSSDTTTVPLLDEWKLKRSLISFLKTSFPPHPVSLPEEDLRIHRFKDMIKRTRHDPVARGSVFIRDLGFIVSSAKRFRGGEGGGERLESKFAECRRVLVEKMDGMEVNLEGVRFTVSVSVPVSDDFESMKKDWEEFFAFEAHPNRGYSRSTRREPDTIILRGLPSRWFAEPRVSSKPSMLVTHTIFSTFGKVRNLNVVEDDDLGKDTDEDDGDIISGLHCKVVVQFEKYREFHDALKVLSSRSLQKDGSRMKADYEVTWDKDGFFECTQERNRRMEEMGVGHHKDKIPRRLTYHSRYSPDDDVRPKRYKQLTNSALGRNEWRSARLNEAISWPSLYASLQ